MKFINTENVIIKSWCDNPEDGAIEQAKNLANLPFIFRQVCLMPDTHEGYGMPIGGVIATRGVIIPNAVGVDIGCGMLAVRTTLKGIDIDTLKNIMGEIRQTIPVGFAHHKDKQDESFIPPKIESEIVTQEYEKAFYQLGTLGGGNHFIEIQVGDDDRIWYMIHSGSRNVGLKVANYYNDIAKDMNRTWYSAVKEEINLAFLPLHNNLADEYIHEMEWCLNFSYANRQVMSMRIQEAFKRYLDVSFDLEVNIHHNYARMEHHYGQDVMVHRKGATSARLGETGIIPGSQGSASYIVEGLGNSESFNSSSHGAGRKMGRKQAIRELKIEDEVKKLGSILHSIRDVKDLDEAPGAYKDINTVMEEQKDLVKIKVKLSPLAVIKG
jgi:tRNA-splicing ligase RtcB